MAYIDHIRRCNRWSPERYRPFFFGTQRIGWIREENAALLAAYPSVFTLSSTSASLTGHLDTAALRTEALADVVGDLAARGAIRKVRNEAYAVKEGWSQPECFQLDRGAVPFFGVKAYGVHVNGFFRRDDGGMALWIGKRSKDKAVEPGKWDNMVAGGQPAGLSLRQNLIKEGGEEASVPAALMRQAAAAGTITYCMEDEAGLRRDTLFVFDLETPASFTPRSSDGEVDFFLSWPLERVLESLRETFDFKFNVALVMLDFAVRRGFLAPDETPDYDALIAGLHPSHSE